MNITRRGFFASLLAGFSASVFYQPKSIGMYDIAERCYSEAALEALIKKTGFHPVNYITFDGGITWMTDDWNRE